MEYRYYNNEKISLLGFGGLRLPDDQNAVQKLVDYVVLHGVNYFDTSYAYMGGKSEVYLGEALSKYSRDSFNIATKIPPSYLTSTADVESIFEDQLNRLKVNYIDYYLIHNLNIDTYPNAIKLDLYEILKEKQWQGKIRHLGFSFHDKPELLSKIINEYEWDFAQIQLNYMDWQLQDAKTQYQILKSKQLPIIVMEPVRGGALATLCEESVAIFEKANLDVSVASWAIRYAATFPEVLTVLSGMTNIGQIEDNIKTIANFKPINENEYRVIEKALDVYLKTGTIPCTGCRYCSDCLKHVDIPSIFAIFNRYNMGRDKTILENGRTPTADFLIRYNILRNTKQAHNCVKCNSCVKKCPQHIDIPANLEMIHKLQQELSGQTQERRPIMYTDHRNVQMLGVLLKEYGIQHIVLSSGTRHMPLMRLVENDDYFKPYIIVDEKSASFFALGLIQQLRQPVAICCTSGTAVANYISGTNEALYQRLPLLIITSDRNPYYIDQHEEQMIDNMLLFKNVKKSVILPIVNTYLDEWRCRISICQAMNELFNTPAGPVHINFIIDGDMEAFNTKELPHVEPIRQIPLLANKYLEKAMQDINNAKRILVLCGQMLPPSIEERRIMEDFAEKSGAVFLVDKLSNFHSDYAIDCDDMFYRISVDNLLPDIFIRIGGHSMIYSGWKLLAGAKYWVVNDCGEITDYYRSTALSAVFKASHSGFFRFLSNNVPFNNADNSYRIEWKSQISSIARIKYEWSDMSATIQLMENLPKNSILHLANSSTIRFALKADLPEGINVYCNRGTNGIDGSLSSFIGASSVTETLAFLIIGDLSFFYDMNGLWNRYSDNKNIRIMLNNNGGAGIFTYIRDYHYDKMNLYMGAGHQTSAKGWVESLGFIYLKADSQAEFDTNLVEFLNPSSKPVFFEVFTNMDQNDRAIKTAENRPYEVPANAPVTVAPAEKVNQESSLRKRVKDRLNALVSPFFPVGSKRRKILRKLYHKLRGRDI
ncbi:hypothetical protein FACS189476_01120 [Spirochaetia bacterium]|nr:hypothetical protein FACS189476_01120 [Spirochaetia bacterium]